MNTKHSGTVRATVVLFCLLALVGCGSAPPSRSDWTAATVAGSPEAVAGVDDRLERARTILDPSGGEEISTAEDETLETLAREVATLLDDPRFEGWPVARARLRTEILFLASGTRSERAGVLATCETNWNALRTQSVAAESTSP